MLIGEATNGCDGYPSNGWGSYDKKATCMSMCESTSRECRLMEYSYVILIL